MTVEAVDRLVNRAVAVLMAIFAVGVVYRGLPNTDLLSFVLGFGLVLLAIWLWDLP